MTIELISVKGQETVCLNGYGIDREISFLIKWGRNAFARFAAVGKDSLT